MSEIKNLGKILNFKAGKLIFSEGEEGNYLYNIVEGTIEIHKGETLLREMGSGESFGEMGVLGRNLRTATAYAKTDATLEAFDHSSIVGLLEKTATVEERRAANNLINYIDRLSQVSVDMDQIKEEVPGKEKLAAYSQILGSYIENNPDIGKVLKSILKLETQIKADIKKKIDDL